MINAARWRVLLLDTKPSNPNHYICLAMETALRSHADVECVEQAHLGNAIVRARASACNLFVAFGGVGLSAAVCRRLRQVCGTAVLWATEDPYELPANVRNAPTFDLIFTTDSGSVAAYGGKGRHLPLAACPDMQHLRVKRDDQCRYDLFFAGAAWPSRVELLQRLMADSQNLKVKFALAENPHTPPIKIDMARSAYAWSTPNQEFCRFANASRTTLALRADSAATGGNGSAATAGPQLFEAAMAGSFQLVDAALSESLRHFTPGKEIVSFTDEQDCVNKLRHYLQHPEQRHEIAIAAQRRTLAEHTYAHRTTALLDAVSNLHPPGLQTAAVVSKRPKILMVTHNLLTQSQWGGVEIYQDMMLRALRDRYEFLIYSPCLGTTGKTCILHDENLEPLRQYTFDEAVDFQTLSCPQREQAFSNILCEHGIAAVHFQHFIWHVPSLASIARALGVPAMLSLHDYYTACSHYNFIGMHGRYCGVEGMSERNCDVCLRKTSNLAAGSQAARRAFYRRILREIDIVHADSQDTADRYRTIYTCLSSHPGLRVKGLPIDEAPAVAPRRTAGRLRVALLGNFAKNKGADAAIEVFSELQTAPIDFVVYGRVSAEYAEALKLANFQNVRVYGPYAPGVLAGELAETDVSLHLSVCPETYCLMLSEAWQAGVVPVVTDLGALGQRVCHGRNGFTFPREDLGALMDLLQALAASPALLEDIRRGSRAEDIVPLPDHVAWLDGVYRHLSAQASSLQPDAEPGQLSLSDCNIFLNCSTCAQGDRPAAVQAPPPPAMQTAQPSNVVRTIRYMKKHGALATVRRIWSEVVH